MNEEHKEFIDEYNEAVKPICEKHSKELVPVFRFGQQWLPAQLIVNEKSDKSETNGSTDSGDQTTQE